MTSPILGRRAVLGAASVLAAPLLTRRAHAADAASLISHRYPALEYITRTS
jgi:hypothetical protein